MKADKLPDGYRFALVGNPNVGKSTVFNAITGLNQHTGNWTGKTVDICQGEFEFNGYKHSITDLPGTYSLLAESEEEAVTAEYVSNGNYDCVIIVADSSTIHRNLNLIVHLLSKTTDAVLCLNMSDIAKKSGIKIDIDELNIRLGIPVVSITAKKTSDIKCLVSTAVSVADKSLKTYCVRGIKSLDKVDNTDKLIKSISEISKEIANSTVYKVDNSCPVASKADKIVTGKISGTIIMLLFVLGLFWLTAYGANYPSKLLSFIFTYIIELVSHFFILLHFPDVLVSFLCDGVLNTAGWVVSVMLPPALIFFPLFAILEDLGYLPRVAFNLDGIFSASGTSGKQSLTMLMGFGCNSCGVAGCRIIPSKKERNAAIITNSFIPCNGRLPMLLTLGSLFFSSEQNGLVSSLITASIMVLLILLSIAMTLAVCKILSLVYKSKSNSFILELPCYKKPNILKTVAVSVKDKVIKVLLRAVAVALPAGAIIWLLGNIKLGDNSLLLHVIEFLDPFARLFGIDGTILSAFLLGFPANEIVTPIIAMAYTCSDKLTDVSSVSELGRLLVSNGWTWLTAICTMIMCVFHFPCSTTCITIYKETKSKVVTLLAIAIPMIIGFSLCGLINLICHIFF